MIQHGKLHLLFQLEVHTNLDVSLHIHPGLSKIRSRAGGPGSDIINLGITIGGQKLGAGRFLIPRAFYRDMVHFILIVMSLPGPPARAGIFDNPGCILVKDGRGWSNRY